MQNGGLTQGRRPSVCRLKRVLLLVRVHAGHTDHGCPMFTPLVKTSPRKIYAYGGGPRWLIRGATKLATLVQPM